jgi:hypothetical protein
MRRTILPVVALSAALITAGCQNPDGSTDWGSTLALGAGVGAAAALVAASANDDGHRHRGYDRGGYRRGYDGYGYRGGYNRGYGRRW